MVIRKKFTLLLLTMSIIPAILIVALYQSSFMIAEKDIKSQFQLVMDEKAKLVLQQQLNDFSKLLSTQNLYVNELLSSLNALLSSPLDNKTIETSTEFPLDTVYYPGTNTNNKELLSYATNNFNNHVESSIVNCYYIVLPDGSAIVNTKAHNTISPADISNIKDSIWYKKTIAEHGKVSKSHTFDITGKELVFIISQAILNDKGQVTAVTAS